MLLNYAVVTIASEGSCEGRFALVRLTCMNMQPRQAHTHSHVLLGFISLTRLIVNLSSFLYIQQWQKTYVILFIYIGFVQSMSWMIDLVFFVPCIILTRLADLDYALHLCVA